ncbi:serine/threonine-protein kinase [Streptomyces sp. ISL-11]|uniref:serine/threonine-protein kinase n=1 Tax=Streptomyces sp. ISL-11 TaxID=2819174 RepID=UPI001BEC6C48|nr:serine/threonine protein kinase [Streptomyces sp. ISL-11]
MGTVWRSEDELLGRQVALKQLHVSAYLEEDELATLYERTRREARSAARINHPNVVVVHDVVDDHGLPCIVMEYVPSTTLGDILKHGPVSPEEAARIGRGMIAALRAAHAAGVLHRDVKPGNVLLGDDGRVVLTDFGIAQASGTSTLTKTGEMVGSIDYIAPERVKGGKPGPASDLWALGATLYQAVEGRPPFRKDTAVETAYSIAMDPLEPPRRAGALARLIETLLAKEPDLRPPAELAEQILREPAAESETAYMSVPEPRTAPAPAAESIPRESTTREKPEATPRAETTESRRSRAPLWIAVAVVLLAGLAGGAYLFLGDSDSDDDSGDDDAAATEPAKDTGPSPAESDEQTPSPSVIKPPPKGYHLVREEKRGVSVSFPVPDGWKRTKATDSDEIVYADPSGLVGLRVSVLELASSDPLQHWKNDEEKSLKEGKLPGYKQLRMEDTEYRGEPAAIWEFTWQGRAREFRAADLGFGRPGEKEYAIYVSAPKADWDKYSPVFGVVRDGFRPDAH